MLDAGLPLQTALLASYLGVFALPLVVLLLGGALSHELLTEREDELQRATVLVTRLFDASFCSGAGPLVDCDVDWTGDDVQQLLRDVRESTGAGVRVLDEHGIIIATTGPNLGMDISGRDEVQAALRGQQGTAGRTQMVPKVGVSRLDPRKEIPVTWAIATAPLDLGGGERGVLVLSRPTREASGAMATMVRGIGPRGFLLLGAGVLGIGFVSWRLSRSLKSLAIYSRRLDAGPEPDLEALTRSRVLEVRELAIAFSAVTERLRARVAYNRDLAANVAHEFKTPLTTLRGIVELLDDQENPLPPEQARVFLDGARTDLDRLSRMVTGLLDLARAEARSPGSSDRVDLDAILGEAGCPVRGSVGRVRGEREGWSTVVRNLVENARVHGAEPVHIEADATGFSVIDAGPGISAANLPRVFERFFTTGNDRQGTGLGLPIVRATVEACGGTVAVTSQPGETRFSVNVAR